MKPAIGIPECHDANGRIRRGREYVYSDIAYARAVCKAGGTALHLPIQDRPEDLVARIDGLLVPGGDDFLPPHSYPDPGVFEPASESQLEFDRHLLDCALERGVPILGICYGAQLLALRFAGTLHYHLPHDLPHAQNHQLEGDGRGHALALEPDSRLTALVGPGPIEVNSLHHQAIATAGDALRVVARSHDGVIEAIEHPGRDFCVGVQWHPEKQPGEASQRLLEGFVRAAAEFAAN